MTFLPFLVKLKEKYQGHLGVVVIQPEYAQDQRGEAALQQGIPPDIPAIKELRTQSD